MLTKGVTIEKLKLCVAEVVCSFSWSSSLRTGGSVLGMRDCFWRIAVDFGDWTKEVNTVPEAVSVWPAVRYILDTGQYRCIVSNLPLFFIILYNIQSYISNNSIYHIVNFLYFFMELLTFTATPYMISCEGWKNLWVYVGSHFHHSQLLTWQIMTKIVKCCNISIVLSIKLLQYRGNMAIHVHYMSHHLGSKPKLKRSDGELIFYSKIKSFQYFQCLATSVSVLSHVESLGNFKNKYKTKKEKVRNQTTYITKFSKKKESETNKEEEEKKRKKKKKKKQLLHGATPASLSSSSFSPSSLFSFLTNETFRVSARYPFTGRKGRISSVQPLCSRYFFRYKKRGLSIPMH